MNSDFYAVDRFQLPLSAMLLKLARSWVLVDPFGVYWTPESTGNDHGVYVLGDELSVLDDGYGWMESTLLMEASTINYAKVCDLTPPDAEGRPDWGQKYDFLLGNANLLPACSDIVVIPELWGGHGSGSNFIAVCRIADRLVPICDGSVITPIVPAALLRQWPTKMLDYIRTGVGLTGKLLTRST